MGSSQSGSTKSVQTTTPWGPQQPYLQQLMQGAANVYGQNIGQGIAPLFQDYINRAAASAGQPIPGQNELTGAYLTGLQSPGVMMGRIQDMISAGYDPNAADPMAESLARQLQSGTGLAQSMTTTQAALGNLGKQAASNPAISNLMRLGGADWASGYTNQLENTSNAAMGNPYIGQSAQWGTIGNSYIPGVGSAAYSQTDNPFLGNVLGAGSQDNQYIRGLAGISGAANPLIGSVMAAGNRPNEYISGTAEASAAAGQNPALSQLQQTASGQFLSPDTNPYLRQAIQAAQEQTQAQIASQFNQGGRYGSGAMAGQEAQQLGNIAAQAYTGQYQQERANQLAAQQALGQQYLAGVGQQTAGQQAAAGLTQQQQYQNLLATGQAAGLSQQQIQNLIAGQQGAAGLTQGQQQLGLGAATSAAGLQQQGLASMLQGLTSQAGLQQSQQGLGLQGLAQAGQMYGQGIGQQLQGLQAAGQLAGQQAGQAANAYNMAGNQYAQGIGQQMQGWENIGSLGSQMVQNALQGTQLYGNLYGQDIANRMQAQMAGTGAMSNAIGQGLQAINAAPVIQGLNNDQLSQLANAAQIQQQLIQMPGEQAWNNLGNYLQMISGNYGGTTTGKTPYYTNQAGSAMGGALGGAALGSMTGLGPMGMLGGAMLGGGMSFLSSRVFKTDRGQVDTNAIISGVKNLPIDSWKYNGVYGDDIRHVGPYAEDFQEVFSLGDGISLPFIDTIGVLFVTVKNLLARIDNLEAEVEEIRNAV